MQLLCRPTSRFDQHIPSINSPRFTHGPASGNIDFWPSDVNSTTNIDEHPVQQTRVSGVSQRQQQGVTSAPVARDENNHNPSTITPQNSASDVMDTNLHTRNLEFYGSASSVAFLRHVETLSNCQTTGLLPGAPERSLASLLHNTDFQPNTSNGLHTAPPNTELNSGRFYFRVARRFLDAYFSNLHQIQPLFEEEVFLARCETLWFNGPGKQPLSFVALYYATLSLGSLVMSFEPREIAGADRFTWSRKLFNEALTIVTRLGTATDIEMVQCFYIMVSAYPSWRTHLLQRTNNTYCTKSKICQHELNPHVAYLYSGQAARISLAIGINRRPISPDAGDPRTSTAASKTWWAVYCLDIQTSLALGRPDSLGPDQYHTQTLPTATSEHPLSTPHVLQIVPCIVGLSRIMRKVGLDLYTQPCDMEEKLRRAKALNTELEYWLERVPSNLRSEHQDDPDMSLKPRRLPSYIKKQSVVLRLRYLNVRMIIHAVFMIDAKPASPDEATLFRKCQCRCIQAAEDAIDLVYSTFRTDDYFQTWWYNSTYTLYAVSILLAMVFRQLPRTQPALETIFAHIDRAIVLLQAMDECLVARNAIAIIRRTLARAKQVPQPSLIPQRTSFVPDALGDVPPPRTNLEHQMESGNIDTLLQSHTMDGNELDETVGGLDWLSTYPFDDSQQNLFWAEWAHEIDTLGT